MTKDLDAARQNALERIRENEAAQGIPDVRALRRRLGISQTELAKMMHVSWNTIRAWEHGRRHPRGPAVMVLQRIGEGVTK